ncbi:uncharacterized protein MYCGRDRAFT_73238 [Zymoseptoria tritici IPO323]|uniref:Uncharacterized protein n=1 Tax=Zymoseptoria tritici (strain CBS 115943 / IPO323) TaxID=336722 RepID=F9XDM1_ZYMTI|nr:uncharacterized protein MYCGRDRAFT_73238 [Zymoseptoria tritici IPO323]EGP86778.1 hypothetical protein MYCGRDRAFT_73238 [Zymoseptoria tritici IPO323]
MASTKQHSRSSASSTSSNGSSYQLILDHILTYPGNYELPLRTMHALNTAQRGSRRSGSPSSSHGSSGSSPATPQGAFPTAHTPTFTEDLLAQVSQLSKASASLPPSFIIEFAQKCFLSDLKDVDFPQALTGLDYLKDLEMRRRREVASAMSRLQIDRKSLDQNASGLLHMSPEVLQWVKSVEEKERKIDHLYTSVFVGIRRWILINEFSLLPFHKHNCVGMLNTLYPPLGLNDQPTSALSHHVLKEQREQYFKYISAVEKNGPRVLGNLMRQGKGPTDEFGWESVVRTLGHYMQLAKSMISECEVLYDVQDLSSRTVIRSSSRHQRKADSGISFGSTYSNDSLPSPVDSNRPTSSSSSKSRQRTSSNASNTALERLARGLRTIGRSRTDPGMLRKMRSMGSLSDRKASSSNLKTMPAFDVEEMRKQRALYEKKNEMKRGSHEI